MNTLCFVFFLPYKFNKELEMYLLFCGMKISHNSNENYSFIL